MPRKRQAEDEGPVGEAGPELVDLPAGGLVLSRSCMLADQCPAAGRGPWLRHVDKDGERTTKHEPDGSFWNRSCPVNGCSVRVYG